MEDKVNELESVFDSAAHEKLKVASVNFGYKNGSLIRALRVRGNLIATAQFHKVAKEDEKINHIINSDHEKLKQPVCAFITFNH